MKLFGAPLDLIHNLCIFGYSYTVYLIVFLVAAIPFFYVQMGVLLYGVAHSSIFLFYNFYKVLEDKLVGNLKFIIIGIVGVFQLVLFFSFYYLISTAFITEDI